MNTRKAIITESEALLGLRGFAEVYEEVAATRMGKVRKSVVLARDFLGGLMEIFSQVRFNQKQKDSGVLTMTTLNQNGRTVVVFISANSGLYGDIIERIFVDFVRFVRENKVDVVVVGKYGLRMMQERLPEVLFNYFDFPDENVDLENLGLIMRYLLQFEKILVFYGKFVNIVTQVSSVANVSGDDLQIPSASWRTKSQIPKKDLYLFEPSLREVLGVFESEILASIFEQTLHESLLAKFASRMLSLDRAIEGIDKNMLKMKFDLRNLKHKMDNKKQLTRISGMSLWDQ